MRKIAILSPNKYKYSETFIHTHILDLPFEKVLLHGGYQPGFASFVPAEFLSSAGGTSDSRENGEVQGNGEVREIGTIPQLPDHPLSYSSWWRKKPSEPEALRRGLHRFLKKEKVQVLLAEYGPSGVAVMDTCYALSIPLVVHFHGYDAYRADILGAQGRHYPEMFARAAALVVVSEDMQRQVIGLGAPAEKVLLIPYGVDPMLFQPTDPGQNPLDLVGVGRFTDKKAPELTIRAFSLVADRFPEARLIMAGEGDLLPACKALVGELGLGERVLFPGRITPEEVADLLQGARGFVQHSLRPENGDSEGLPLAVLEAMATGLPVVATRHAGIPDAVREGREGLLCSEGAVETMAENMGRILEHPEYAAELGRAGRLRIVAHYQKSRYLGDLSTLLAGI